jgi:hypothetical protein
MTRFTFAAAVGLVVLSAVSAQAAGPKPVSPVVATAQSPASPPFRIAKDGTTNITDCAKVAAAVRNDCISRARPVSGKQIYAKLAADKAADLKQATRAAAKAEKLAKVAKVAAASGKAQVAANNVPKGFKVAKDGTTHIADCAKAAPNVRNECISRARPLTGKELIKFETQRAAAVPKVKPETKSVAKKKTANADSKSFPIASDGTTDIAHCAAATQADRNECISRSRPVTGAALGHAIPTRS